VLASSATCLVSAADVHAEAGQSGLFALTPGANADGIVTQNNDGTLSFNFGSGSVGLQAGSTYTWDSLFGITNRSEGSLSVCLSASGELGQYLTFRAAAGQQWPAGRILYSSRTDQECEPLIMPAGAQLLVDASIHVPAAAQAGSVTGNIGVTAHPIQ
jgi:hypothetical protein